MSFWKTGLWIAFLAGLGAILTAAFLYLRHTGQFGAGGSSGGFNPFQNCVLLEGPSGVSDIAADPRSPWTYLSASGLHGAIYVLRTDDPDQGIHNLTGGLLETFRPRAISLWIAPDGQDKRLFALTDSETGTDTGTGDPQPPQAVIFAIDEAADTPPRLRVLRTITDPLFQNPSDLAAAGPEQFYLPTGRRFDGGSLSGRAEDLLRLPLSSVVYFDGDTARIVAEELAQDGGIALGADGRLYVGERMASRVRIFEVAGDGSGALDPLGSLTVGAGPVKLDVDGAGALWVLRRQDLLGLSGPFDPGSERGQTGPELIAERLEFDEDAAAAYPAGQAADLWRLTSAGPVGFDGERLVVGSALEPVVSVCSRAGQP